MLEFGIVRPRREEEVKIEREMTAAIEATNGRPGGAHRLVKIHAVQVNGDRRRPDRRPPPVFLEIARRHQNRARAAGIDRLVFSKAEIQKPLNAKSYASNSCEVGHVASLSFLAPSFSALRKRFQGGSHLLCRLSSLSPEARVHVPFNFRFRSAAKTSQSRLNDACSLRKSSPPISTFARLPSLLGQEYRALVGLSLVQSSLHHQVATTYRFRRRRLLHRDT